MVGGGLGERERLNGKAPIELSDESSTRAVITSSKSDCVGSVNAVQNPPQAIEKPTDAFGRPSVHGVGTSIQGERQLDFDFEVLIPHPNLLSVTEQGRKRGRRQGYPKLNMLPRDSTPKPHEPCYIFERELQSIQNASAEGAKLVTEELKIDTGPLCGTGMDSCEGETSADTECGCCAQCGTGMDECEGEASVDNECGRYPQSGTHMESCEGETSTYIEGGCCCSDDQLEEPIQFAEGFLLCYTCLGRIIEESTYGESEASNSLPCMDTSSCEESFPGSAQVETSLASSKDAVVPQI